MKLRWSERAVSDLEAIYDYIAEDKPDAAASVVEKVIQTAERLQMHPHLGRAGRYQGTRELIHPPFVIVYSIAADAINIHTIFHGNRRYD